MAESPDTRPSLLIRIRNAQDDQAWSQFVAIYAPLIYGYARKHGLQDHDAADLTQDVLGVVARTIRGLEYDRHRGTFRGWLFTITRNKLLNLLARQNAHPQATGDTGTLERLHEEPARAEFQQDAWDQAYEQQLFAWACDQVRQRVEERTWNAFWQTAVEGRQAKPVAEELAMTVAAVRLAKSRVMSQIRQLIQDLQIE